MGVELLPWKLMETSMEADLKPDSVEYRVSQNTFGPIRATNPFVARFFAHKPHCNSPG